MTDAQADDEQPKINRRRALMAAGAAALGVTISELVPGETTASAQTTGQSLLLGRENTSTATTTLVARAATGAEPPTHGLDIQADDSNYGLAVSGNVWGVYSLGLLGGSFVGNNDYGAAIELYPRVGSGPPTEGLHFSGELVVDDKGRLYLCDRSDDEDTGATARWEQVSHRGVRFLPQPVRVTSRFDGQIAAGQTRVVDIRAKAGIPAEATGIFANLELVAPRNTGYISVYAAGGTRPPTANLSWTQTDGYLANFVMSRVNGAGRVAIFASQPTAINLDVAGYVL